jgi:hypothetical protein
MGALAVCKEEKKSVHFWNSGGSFSVISYYYCFCMAIGIPITPLFSDEVNLFPDLPQIGPLHALSTSES